MASIPYQIKYKPTFKGEFNTDYASYISINTSDFDTTSLKDGFDKKPIKYTISVDKEPKKKEYKEDKISDKINVVPFPKDYKPKIGDKMIDSAHIFYIIYQLEPKEPQYFRVQKISNNDKLDHWFSMANFRGLVEKQEKEKPLSIKDFRKMQHE